MVEYYENEAALEVTLKRAKTPREVRKILQDLEQRMAPGIGKIRPWRYSVN